MPRKTKAEAEKTRVAILKAAERKFYENGVVSTSLQDIAKAAGVTRGAVYWHFRDKGDLLKVLADMAYMPHEAILAKLVEENLEEPLGMLCADCCATLNALTNDPSRRRLLTILLRRCEYIEGMKSLNDRNNVCRNRVLERLTVIFQKAAQKGRLSPLFTPETAALALQNLAIGFVYNEMDYPRPSRARDKARNAALRSFFMAIAGEPCCRDSFCSCG